MTASLKTSPTTDDTIYFPLGSQFPLGYLFEFSHVDQHQQAQYKWVSYFPVPGQYSPPCLHPNIVKTHLLLDECILPPNERGLWIGKDGCHLKRLTEATGVLYMFCTHSTIEIWGDWEGINKARRALYRHLQSYQRMRLRSEIPPFSHIPIGMIIGKHGSTFRKIENDTGVGRIHYNVITGCIELEGFASCALLDAQHQIVQHMSQCVRYHRQQPKHVEPTLT